MNLINLSDGHVDALIGVLRLRIQEWMVTDDPHPKLIGGGRNYDRAAHLLTIYDQLCAVAAKWDGGYPQFGCRPLDDSGQEREVIKGTNLYLARDGTLKRRHLPD